MKLISFSWCLIGVKCYDVSNGYRCGPCPPGMTGDGRRGNCVVARIGCDTNPCFKGVQCVDTTDGFRCGNCPVGYDGNGTHCRDQDEVGTHWVGGNRKS